VAVCIDVEQPENSLREMLQRADTAGVFVSSAQLPIIRQLAGEAASLLTLVRMGEKEDEGTEPSIDDWCAQGERILADGRAVSAELAVHKEQAAAIVFTSGTTSLSKMVMLSHINLLQNASESIVYATLGPKVFTPLPFFHAYGLTCAALNTLVRGAQLVINGNLRTMKRDMSLAKPYTLMAVPLMVESLHSQIWLAAEREGKTEQIRRLLKGAAMARRLGLPWQNRTLLDMRKKAAGDLHIIISGGEYLNGRISEELELFGILVLQGYGITECSPLISVNCNHSYKHGTLGHVLPSFEIRFVDDEIWVKGPAVMMGYYKEPEQTAEVLEDGWFKTGDLGYMDKNGFLCLTGRKKNLIVFQNGKKLSPEKLEEMIRPLPLVNEVIVQGTVNGSSTDDVKLTASIFPDPAQTEDMSSYEILDTLQKEIDRINDGLPSYQQIKLLNIREQEFERTASKKIKRHLV
jgi:long-chain acyl-CoA synthetase